MPGLSKLLVRYSVWYFVVTKKFEERISSGAKILRASPTVHCSNGRAARRLVEGSGLGLPGLTKTRNHKPNSERKSQSHSGVQVNPWREIENVSIPVRIADMDRLEEDQPG